MLSALELPKSTGSYWENEKQSLEETDESIKPLLQEVIDEYPEYGRPRITEELQEEYGLDINHKVIGKLLKTWDIALQRAARGTSLSPVEKAIQEAGSDADRVKERLRNGPPIELFEVLYTDFTTIEWANGHSSAKLIFGWSLGPSETSIDGLSGLERGPKNA